MTKTNGDSNGRNDSGKAAPLATKPSHEGNVIFLSYAEPPKNEVAEWWEGLDAEVRADGELAAPAEVVVAKTLPAVDVTDVVANLSASLPRPPELDLNASRPIRPEVAALAIEQGAAREPQSSAIAMTILVAGCAPASIVHTAGPAPGKLTNLVSALEQQIANSMNNSMKEYTPLAEAPRIGGPPPTTSARRWRSTVVWALAAVLLLAMVPAALWLNAWFGYRPAVAIPAPLQSPMATGPTTQEPGKVAQLREWQTYISATQNDRPPRSSLGGPGARDVAPESAHSIRPEVPALARRAAAKDESNGPPAAKSHAAIVKPATTASAPKLVAPPPAFDGLIGGAARVPTTPANGRGCRIWTASYGGEKAIIITAIIDKIANYFVLAVNEGRETREAADFISAYAKDGSITGEFGGQRQALDKALKLCPEG